MKKQVIKDGDVYGNVVVCNGMPTKLTKVAVCVGSSVIELHPFAVRALWKILKARDEELVAKGKLEEE